MSDNNFYEVKKKKLWEMYWKDNDGEDIFRPNGFSDYPDEIYDLFLSFIDHDGKVIDLGCGNGLLLRHLVTKSQFKLIPFGVDFIEESIKQAQQKVLPEFAENFVTANIIEYDLGEKTFDFILFDPYNLHPSDIPRFVERLIKACKKNGKIIFYTYEDVLTALNLTWVGDMLPKEIRGKLKRIDHEEVSVGVLQC